MCSTCRKKRTQYAGRAAHLMDKYGITELEYDEILEAQGGGCAITGTKPYGKVHLDVDHDHAVEKMLLARGVLPQVAARASVRGLLSRAANRRLLPSVRDDVAKLQAAIDYLNDPPAQKVLKCS